MDKLNTEILHKELDLIQACINRMASNSFLIKGWMITLVAALVALLADKVSVYVIVILAIVVVLGFWYLDGFFLKTEKLFRLKYEWVIEQRLKGNAEYLYDLNPYNSAMWKTPKYSEKSIFRVMFSTTLIPFYTLPLFLAVVSILWALIFPCSMLSPVMP